jgi:hypothetical protein
VTTVAFGQGSVSVSDEEASLKNMFAEVERLEGTQPVVFLPLLALLLVLLLLLVPLFRRCYC